MMIMPIVNQIKRPPMNGTNKSSKTYTLGLSLWVLSFVILTVNYEITNLNFPKSKVKWSKAISIEWFFQNKW